MGNTITKFSTGITVWKLPSGDTVVLTHDSSSGNRTIVLAGAEGPPLHASRKTMDNGSIHELTIAGQAVIVTISMYFASFKYSCTCDGKKVASHVETVSQPQDDLSFTVSGTEIRDAGATKAVFYTLEVRSKAADGKVVATSQRRFSEFDDVKNTIHSMYHDSHMSKSIPAMPAKALKLTSNHLDATFIEQRKRDLDAFVKNLQQFPGIMEVPGFKAFLAMEEDQI